MTALFTTGFFIACAIGAMIKMIIIHAQKPKAPHKRKVKANRRVDANFLEDFKTINQKH